MNLIKKTSTINIKLILFSLKKFNLKLNFFIPSVKQKSLIFLNINSLKKKLDYTHMSIIYKNNFFFYKKYLNIKKSTIFFTNFYSKTLLNKKNTFIKAEELELKGINYRFTKLLTNLLLDLGCSHFQILTYPLYNFFFSLKKKKQKKILFINFNKFTFLATVNFF